MAAVNSNATNQPASNKPLAEDAVNDFSKFMSITKENQQALDAWNDHLKHHRVVIDGAIGADGKPFLFLNKQLAAFIGTEVNHD